MITGIYRFIAAAVAWGAALSFLRMKRSGILFYSVFISLLCGCVSVLPGLAEIPRFGVLAEFVVFLVSTMILQLQRREHFGDTVLAFFIAQGAYALFCFCTDAAGEYAGVKGGSAACLLPALFLIGTAKLAKRFPDPDWREYYADTVAEPDRIDLRIWHSYLVLGSICVLLTAGEWLMVPGSIGEVLCLGIAGGCLFWFGVVLVILMNAYKKERIAVLVEQQYRGEMQSFMNVIRSQRHDYNFHVQTIAGLIQQGKIEECRRYVNALEQDASIMNAVLPVKDPAISAMIHNFQILAAREGIELHIDIQNDLSQIATNVYETNKMISNLLQNAIDETVTHKDKSYGIGLTILKRGEYCVIRVSNELEERVLTGKELGQLYQQGYTTKYGHDGVGLSSIRLLASRYHGTVYTQIDGKVIHFIAKIPVNYAKKPGEEVNDGENAGECACHR